jgi:hypothetical protein
MPLLLHNFRPRIVPSELSIGSSVGGSYGGVLSAWLGEIFEPIRPGHRSICTDQVSTRWLIRLTSLLQLLISMRKSCMCSCRSGGFAALPKSTRSEWSEIYVTIQSAWNL